MTPQEKAKELVDKFMTIDSDSEMFDGFRMKQFYAQRCAIIAVDEIIEVAYWQGVKDYWQEIKQEIEKL